MPVLKKENYSLYYEDHGAGVPILFLEGLGYSMWMWKYQIPALKKRFRCIMVDNRGVGKSSPLVAPYSMEHFAQDALFVLDDLGIKQFFVLGVSMGGFIAQEMARLSQDRVKGLVLVSSSCGGKKSYPMPEEIFREMTRKIEGESPEDKLRRVMPLALTSSFPIARKGELDEIVEDRLLSLQDDNQLMFQSLSAVNFDACGNNARINIPTLIVSGTSDKVLNWFNGLLLYKSLPHSSIAMFPDQNHLLFMEEHEKFNELVKSFVDEVEGYTYSESIREVR